MIPNVKQEILLVTEKGREEEVITRLARVGLTDAFGDKYPDYIKENKGHNQYYMLPLILGLIGFFFQAKKDPHSFYVNLMLFLMMGVILVIYLNSPPVEPRERDYIYVGSFYAFAIWIGMGVLGLAHGISKYNKNLATAGIIATLITLPVAGLMGVTNWDDHNRTGRYFSVDAARNFLNSCAPNAILFTGGDNDTFPLWYVQEVEGFRTDVRVIVLSYFDTDWYVDQMARSVNDSEALPFSLTSENYKKGTNDVLYITGEEENSAISARAYLSLLKSNDKRLNLQTGGKSIINMVPSRNLILDVDSSFINNDEIVPPQFKSLFTSQMNLQVKGQYLTKGNLMLVDLITNNNWERPIYFNNTSLATIGLNLDDHVVMEGLTYRLLPIQKPSFIREDLVNTDLAYTNFMEVFKFRELENTERYYDEEYRRFVSNHRSSINSVAISLLEENQMDKARELLNYGLKVMPDSGIPYDLASGQSVPLFFEVGEEEKALEIIESVARKSLDMIEFYDRENRDFDREILISIEMVRYFIPLLQERGYQDMADEYRRRLEAYLGPQDFEGEIPMR